MEADREWGRQWIESVVMDVGFQRSLASCLPEVIASMYKLLHTEYPPATRPDRPGGFAGPIDMIHDLKDYLIRHLSQSGIEGSSTALESISIAFPFDRWLHDLILDAGRNEEAARLPTLSFAVIKELREKNSASRRMINSIGDLHDLVFDKLTDYQLHLQGDTPAIGELWDNRTPVRPKENEENLSDCLYRFLRITIGRGLVINREVQIRRKQYSGGNTGSRTDLWIQAIAEDGQLTLCIEVKCNWNETSKSALKDQLIDKYMSGGTAGAGILVLGWYACPGWDPTDGRLSKSTKTWLDANSARADLDGQCTRLRDNSHYVSAAVIDCSLS